MSEALREQSSDFDALRRVISQRYDTMSQRLQQVARFALERPNEIALETVAVIAERAGVPPSTLIRFAKALDYKGFTDMQRVFRARLVRGSPSYSERIHAMRQQIDDPLSAGGPKKVLAALCAVDIAALEHLRDEIDEASLLQAVDLLAKCRAIHVIGFGRAYPVATYLFYALNQPGARAHLLDGVGGMVAQQAKLIDRRDVLVAVSYATYTPQVIEAIEVAREIGASVIAITDGPLSPLASRSTVTFPVQETPLHDFRSLSASLCLAQSLVVSLGFELDAAAGAG